MTDFLSASAGTWMIRRVVHHMDHQDDEAGDSNLTVAPFGTEDDCVASICAALGVDKNQACGGARFWWESNLGGGGFDRRGGRGHVCGHRRPWP